MTGVLAEKEIQFDRDIIFRPKTENIEERYNPSMEKLYCPFDIDSEGTSKEKKNKFFDEIIIDFFKEKWIKRLENIQATEDVFLSEENIPQPNDLAINYAYQVINGLAEKNIFPDKLSTTVEEGICLKFRNKGMILYFEVYNTGELGYIIEDPSYQKIIENEDIYSIEEMVNRINDFIMN